MASALAGRQEAGDRLQQGMALPSWLQNRRHGVVV